MEEVNSFLEMVAKYGIPIIISGVAILISVDLYLTSKQTWIPNFLSSFNKIADNTQGINESMHEISEQTRLIQGINTKLDLALAQR